MTQNNKDARLLGMLGLAQRAGKLKSGEFSVEKSIKGRRAKLCIIASDATDGTKKKFKDMCAFRKVPFMICETDKAELGHAIGKDERSSVCLEDESFAKNILVSVKGGYANE